VTENLGGAEKMQFSDWCGQWQTELRQRLPAYMIPSGWVQLDQLPLTTSGKIDHKALPEPQKTSHNYVSPRTPVEVALAAIWAEVLRVDRLGIKDNFFDLGGHSLLATQLVSRVQNIFKVELPLRQLFEQPTIEHMSQYIMTLPLTDDASELVPIPRDFYGGWEPDEICSALTPEER
jgi:acyl carrier protein